MPPAHPTDGTMRLIATMLAWALVLTLAVNVLTLAGAVYIIEAVNRVVHSGSLPTLALLTGLVLAAMAAKAVLDYGRRELFARLAEKLESGWVQRLVPRCLQERGQVESSLDDVRQTARSLHQFALPVADALLVPVVFLALAWLHPLLGWLAVAAAIIEGLVLVIGSWWVWRASTAHAGQSAVGLQSRRALVGDGMTVVGNGMVDAISGRLIGAHLAGTAAETALARQTAFVASLASWVTMTLTIGFQCLGIWLIVRGELSIGALFGVSMLAVRVLAPIGGLGQGFAAAIQGWRAWQRIRPLLAPTAPAAGSRPALRGGLTLRGLRWHAAGTPTPLFEGFDLELPAGRTAVLAGPVGCGKSTMLRLMAGIDRPTGGEILWGGHALAGIDPAHRGAGCGYLPQTPHLFAGTVAENIARFLDGVDQAEIEAAATLAGCHQDILAMPDGYRTRIGAGGIAPSGGQCQLISLARAVFRRPAQLFLDEPNANLDGDRENALMRCIRELAQGGSTVVVASHRSRILAVVDTVVLFEGRGRPASMPREEFIRQRQAQTGRTAAP